MGQFYSIMRMYVVQENQKNPDLAWRGVGVAGSGSAWVSYYTKIMARSGETRTGKAGPGSVFIRSRRGGARRGRERQGRARDGFSHEIAAGHASPRRGAVRIGAAWSGWPRQGSVFI
jgi:hypothetical protein